MGKNTLLLRRTTILISGLFITTLAGAAPPPATKKPAPKGRTSPYSSSSSSTSPPSQPAAAAAAAPRVAPPAPEAPAAVPMSTASSTASTAELRTTSSSSASTDKVLTVYFDFLAFSRPGVNDFSFANIHSYVFMDVLASPKFQFSFDLSSARGSPSYYELSYQPNSKMQLRLGKIWVPFDDMNPHNLFGGRVNAQELAVTSSTTAFLPNLWTDLGAALKYVPVDTFGLRLETHIYALNGFGESASGDPLTNGRYPNFGDTGVLARDNNKDKAIGARVHATLGGGRLGVGASYQTGRWNNQSDTEALRLTALGFDSQIRLSAAELRAGLIQMKFGVPGGDSANRGGFYGELGIPFAGDRWKLTARGGALNFDDRVIDNNDQTIVGGALLYQLLPWQWSFEHNRDVQKRAGKAGLSYTAIRCIIRL